MADNNVADNEASNGPQVQFPLFRLPVELRRLVYKKVCEPSTVPFFEFRDCVVHQNGAVLRCVCRESREVERRAHKMVFDGPGQMVSWMDPINDTLLTRGMAIPSMWSHGNLLDDPPSPLRKIVSDQGIRVHHPLLVTFELGSLHRIPTCIRVPGLRRIPFLEDCALVYEISRHDKLRTFENVYGNQLAPFSFGRFSGSRWLVQEQKVEYIELSLDEVMPILKLRELDWAQWPGGQEDCPWEVVKVSIVHPGATPPEFPGREWREVVYHYDLVIDSPIFAHVFPEHQGDPAEQSNDIVIRRLWELAADTIEYGSPSYRYGWFSEIDEE